MEEWRGSYTREVAGIYWTASIQEGEGDKPSSGGGIPGAELPVLGTGADW